MFSMEVNRPPRSRSGSKADVILLCLFVINLGIAFGAGVYEHRIVVPEWLTASESGLRWNAEAARRFDTGLRFWAFVTTMPLTLLTVANLVAAWRSAAGGRSWWLAAGMTALADRILTFAYFIPTMIALMAAPDSSDSVALAGQWSTLNYLRHGLVLTAWLCSLQAFWSLAQHRTAGR
jgi:hypothetical protein